MKKTTSYINILSLAIPAIISGLSEPLIGSTDLVLVGKNTSQGIAVVGIGGSAILSIIWILASFLSPISARVANLYGENGISEIRPLVSFLLQKIIIASVVITSSLYFLSHHIVAFYDSPEVNIRAASELYFQIRLIGLPFLLFSIFSFHVFRGLQNTVNALIVTLIGGGINLMLDFLLIKGLWVFPELGVQGAAVASTVSHMFMAFGCLLYLKKYKLLKRHTSKKMEIKPLLINSVNLFIRTVLLNACILIGNRITSKQGADFIETHTIMANIFIVIAYFLDGVAHATTAITGKLRGQQKTDKIKLVGFKGLLLNCFVTLIFLVFLSYNENSLLSFYSSNSLITELFSPQKNIFLVTIFLGCIAFTFDGIYIGLENTPFLRNTLIISTCIGYFPVLLLTQDYSLHGVWIALLCWMFLRAIIPLVHFLKYYVLPSGNFLK